MPEPVFNLRLKYNWLKNLYLFLIKAAWKAKIGDRLPA